MGKSDSRGLINSALWYERVVDDAVFGDEEITEHTLEGIRVSETTSAITYSSEGETRSANIVLFFFIGFSTCDGLKDAPSWRRGDRLKYASVEYVIKGIRQCYDGRSLHHLEVTLE